MDTVEPAKGKKAVSHEDGTVTSDGTTVLGADDLAGVTAIYEAVRHLIETKTPHRPIEILISTGEELYCKGANAFDYSQVQAKEAYVLDLSGAIGAAAYAAPTLVSFAAKIQGKAAHAGFHPEDGINSIQAAACAIAQLPQGHVDESTTANIGEIGGGSGTNIVSESCVIEGEIRSLNHETAMELLETYHRTFQQEVEKIGAKLVWEEKLNIHAYETPLTSDAARHYESAVAEEGLTAAFEKNFRRQRQQRLCTARHRRACHRNLDESGTQLRRVHKNPGDSPGGADCGQSCRTAGSLNRSRTKKQNT